MYEILKTKNGNDFICRISDGTNISVLEAGYIITPDGYFVNVKDDDDHSDIFSQYLSKYLEKNVVLSTIDAATELTELGHIIYCGIKPVDVKTLTEGQYNSSEGYGVFILPNDLSVLTPSQIESCLNLINTNKSFFGHGEKIQLDFNQIKQEKKLTKEEIIEYLENAKNKKK